MAFLNKLNQVAKNLGEKTNDAIETTKLNSKVYSERNAAGEVLKKIGQHYYDMFAAGYEADAEVVDLCQKAKVHFDAAAAADGATATCSACGTANPVGTKFCSGCGARLDVAEQPQTKRCPACGAEMQAEMRFCAACGHKVEE